MQETGNITDMPSERIMTSSRLLAQVIRLPDRKKYPCGLMVTILLIPAEHGADIPVPPIQVSKERKSDFLAVAIIIKEVMIAPRKAPIGTSGTDTFGIKHYVGLWQSDLLSILLRLIINIV